jgi:hypothetical protein
MLSAPGRADQTVYHLQALGIRRNVLSSSVDKHVYIYSFLEETVIFRSATHLLWRHRMSALVAAVALGASGAMLLGAMQTSASAISTVHPAQLSSRLLGPVTTVHVRAITPPTSSGLPGVDTGIHLAPDEVAVITATGTASCAAGNPTGLCVYLSPNGGGSGTGAAPAFFDPNAPAYSLVGEAGSGPLAFIGVGATTVQGPGELRLGYNDQLGLYFDNGGGFTVTIQVATQVNVPAVTPPTSSGLPGVDTGIHLARGEVAVINATGTANCLEGTATCTNLGPNGGEPLNVSTPFLDPNAPAYSLVGEVGRRPLTFIGAGPTAVRGPGELRLGYNDQIGSYSDNSGGFTVTIQTCSPVGHKLRCHGLCGRSSIRAHTPCSVWWGASPLLKEAFHSERARGDSGPLRVTAWRRGGRRGLEDGSRSSRYPRAAGRVSVINSTPMTLEMRRSGAESMAYSSSVVLPDKS